MATVTYKRPSGTEITVVDTPDTRELAKASGWKKKAKRRTTKKVDK